MGNGVGASGVGEVGGDTGAAVEGDREDPLGGGVVGGDTGADVLGGGVVGVDEPTSNVFVSLLPNCPPDATSLSSTFTE